jgi:hypothetical protein
MTKLCLDVAVSGTELLYLRTNSLGNIEAEARKVALERATAVGFREQDLVSVRWNGRNGKATDDEHRRFVAFDNKQIDKRIGRRVSLDEWLELDRLERGKGFWSFHFEQ